MFANDTVFILGAGASCHYGYPTGETLSRLVAARAIALKARLERALDEQGHSLHHTPAFILNSIPEEKRDDFEERRSAWARAARNAGDLAERIWTVDPVVIDYFLGVNSDIAQIGKMMIAFVMLDCERQDSIRRGAVAELDLNRPPPKDNWLRFIVHKLIYNCPSPADLPRNRVSFVTFNYDVSLETVLYESLHSINMFSGNASLDKFFSADRFMHVYGCIRQGYSADPLTTREQAMLQDISTFKEIPRREPDDKLTFWIDFKSFFDKVYDCSLGIDTIAPGKKRVTDAILRARYAIERACCVYILGYGFDESNNSILELERFLNLRETKKTVMFTNFDDHNIVNKRASRLFFKKPNHFVSNTMMNVDDELGVPLCEKSILDVYRAIANDFDALEERLLPLSRV